MIQKSMHLGVYINPLDRAPINSGQRSPLKIQSSTVNCRFEVE